MVADKVLIDVVPERAAHDGFVAIHGGRERALTSRNRDCRHPALIERVGQRSVDIDEIPQRLVQHIARPIADDIAGIIQAGHEGRVGRSVAKGKEVH